MRPSWPYILVAHNDPDTLEQLYVTLEDQGQVLCAMDIQTTLYQAHKRRIDLAVLGDLITDTPGTELIRYLRAIPTTIDTALLMVTPNPSDAYAEQLLHHGAADLVLQPLNPPLIRSKSKTYLTLKRQIDQLRSQNVTDHITGVGSLTLLHQALEHEWQRAYRNGSSIAALLIEIDEFKNYLSHYGQQATNQCLATVATALALTLKRVPDRIARYDEHHFLLLLPETTLPQARYVAERAYHAVKALTLPHATSTLSPIVTVSIGIAEMKPWSMGLYMQNKLIQSAMEALFFARLAPSL